MSIALHGPPDATFASFAAWYAAHGWAVFPCLTRGKTPRIPGGFKGASTDPETVRQWWLRWPDANVAVATGGMSGIFVVDIDVGKGGRESFTDLADAHGGAPDTVRQLTGSGGEHLLFRHPADCPRNTAGKLGAGIDTRGDGGYIIVPSSIHPDTGAAYSWVDGCEPWAIELADLPAWLNPNELVQQKPAEIRRTVFLLDAAGDRVKRCIAYLKTTPNAVSGQGGHDVTLRAACECVRFGLHDGEIAQVMDWYNAEKCDPPWSDGEIRHKIVSAKSKAVFGERLMEDPSPVHIDLSAQVAAATVVEEPADEAVAEVVRPPFPHHLLENIPGTIGRICNWINETATMPQPILTLANVLPFWGAVVGRKVASITNLRTNLYAMGVADSGAGKNHSRERIIELAAEAGISSMIGGEIASDSGLLAALYRQPSCLFQWDEAGHFFAMTTARGSGSHLRQIPATLTKLFSAASTTYMGKEYADQKARPRQDIEQPNACFYGTTVPDRLYQSLTTDEIRDGFLGRILLFVSDDNSPARREGMARPAPPGSIVDEIQHWVSRSDLPRARGGNLAGHEPIEVPLTSAAARLFRALDSRATKAKLEARESEKGIYVLHTRTWEHAMKIALIVASGCNMHQPEIDEEVAAWSIDLVEFLIRNLITIVETEVADNEHEAVVNRVLKIIAKSRQSGVSRYALSRRTQWLKQRDRKDVLEQLIESGRVAAVERHGSRGPVAVVYVAAEYA